MTKKSHKEYTTYLRRKNTDLNNDTTHTVSLSTNYQSDGDEFARTQTIDDTVSEHLSTDKDQSRERAEESPEFDYTKIISDLKYTTRVLEDRSQACSLLNDVFSDFCSIEYQYVERLRMLRDKIEQKSSDSVTGAVPVLSSLKSYIAKMAENHADFLDSISNECFLEMKNHSFQEISRKVDEMKTEFESYKSDRLYYLSRMQESYYKAKNAVTLCLDATHQAPSIKTSVHKTVIPVILSFIEVNNHVNKYDEFTYFTDFNNRVDSIISQLIGLEKSRCSELTQVVSKFIVYETSKVRNLQYDLNSLIETLNNFDPSQDFQGELMKRHQLKPNRTNLKMRGLPVHEIKELSSYLLSNTTIQPPPFKVISKIEENMQRVLDNLWKDVTLLDLKEFSDMIQSSLVRQIFCDLLWKSTATHAEITSSERFEALAHLVDSVLLISHRQADYWCGYSILKISDKFYTFADNERNEKKYLQASISGNGYWRRIEFWEECLTIILSLDLKALFETASCLNGSIGRIEPVPCTEDSLNFLRWMNKYGVPLPAGAELIRRVCAKLKLPQSYTHTLIQS